MFLRSFFSCSLHFFDVGPTSFTVVGIGISLRKSEKGGRGSFCSLWVVAFLGCLEELYYSSLLAECLEDESNGPQVELLAFEVSC